MLEAAILLSDLALEPITCSHLVFFSCEQEFHFLNQSSSPSWSKGRKPGERRENAYQPPVQVSGELWASGAENCRQLGGGREETLLRCWREKLLLTSGLLFAFPGRLPSLPDLHLHSSVKGLSSTRSLSFSHCVCLLYLTQFSFTFMGFFFVTIFFKKDHTRMVGAVGVCKGKRETK